eukprot:SAG31_NODE_43422_length_267_cov_0.619048_1_plen_40_part_01
MVKCTRFNEGDQPMSSNLYSRGWTVDASKTALLASERPPR